MFNKDPEEMFNKDPEKINNRQSAMNNIKTEIKKQSNKMNKSLGLSPCEGNGVV